MNKMNFVSKKTTGWLMLLLVVLVVSCSKDDDPVIDKANLTGSTWTFDHLDAGNELASTLLGAFLEGTTYTFNTDNTYQTVVLSLESTGTWAYANGVITLNPGDQQEEVWQVVELATNSLVYSATSVDDQTGDETEVTYYYRR